MWIDLQTSMVLKSRLNNHIVVVGVSAAINALRLYSWSKKTNLSIVAGFLSGSVKNTLKHFYPTGSKSPN